MNAKDVCRTCFQADGTMFPLFDTNATLPLDSPVFTFIEMLEFFTDIRIPYNDGCPIQLCTDCHDDAQRIYTFILKCRRSDASLKELKDVELRPTKLRDESHRDKNENDATENVNRLQNENSASKKIKEEPFSDYPMEYLDTAPEQSKSSQCLQRQRDTMDFVDGQPAKMKTIKKEPYSDPMEKLDTAPEQSENLMHLQIDRNTGNVFQIFVDGHLVQLKVEPELDIVDENFDQPYSKYPTCTEISNDDPKRDIDLDKSHDKEMAEKVCLTNLNSNEYEKSIQHGFTAMPSTSDSPETAADAPYGCSERFETFRSESKLDEHMKIHSEQIEQFKCKLCSNQHHNQGDLKIHMKSKHSTRTHKCEMCGKLFKRNSQLTRHMDVHRNGKLIKCELCTHFFCSKSSLPHHMRAVHLDALLASEKYSTSIKNYFETMNAKKFICGICFKKFRTQSLREEHAQIHVPTALKFTCEICDKGFRTKHHLKCHEIMIHPPDSPTNDLQ